MLEIFHYNKIMLKFAGLSITPVSNVFYRLVPFFWLMAATAIILPSINYLSEHLTDIADTSDVYYTLVGSVLIAGKFGVIWSRLEEVELILGDLQRIVDRRESLE